MRTGAAAGHRGYRHEAVLHGSDEELLAVAVPFLDGAVEAGEPAVVALDEAGGALVRAAVADPSALTFIAPYGKPAGTIKAVRALLAGHVALGAAQIRIFGEVPHPGRGAPWDWWARYEAAVNHAYDDFPLWGMCSYDTRITPPEVLADVVRTHPYTSTADTRHLSNPGFEDPIGFLTGRPPAADDPLQSGPPATRLLDPSPAAARRAVLDAARPASLDPVEVEDLLFAVHEAVSNAISHGAAPVRVAVWTGTDRVVVTVSDGGNGPADPFAGLIPTTETSTAGLGLWLAHEMCGHVTLARTGEGFTISLTAGRPYLGGPGRG